MAYDLISRAQLMHVADYDVPRFQALQRRDQLPFRFWWKYMEGRRGKYAAFGAWLLVASDFIFKLTGMSRDDIADWGENELVILLSCYLRSLKNETEILIVRCEPEGFTIRTGERAEMQGYVNEGLDAGYPTTILDVRALARSVNDRATAAGIEVAG